MVALLVATTACRAPAHKPERQQVTTETAGVQPPQDSSMTAPNDAFEVIAVLTDVSKPTGCGIIHFGGIVGYRIVDGRRDLIGKDVKAIVSCPDFYPPFSSRAPGAGSVPTLAVGQRHRLVLTHRNAHGIEMPSELPRGEHVYYAWSVLRGEPAR